VVRRAPPQPPLHCRRRRRRPPRPQRRPARRSGRRSRPSAGRVLTGVQRVLLSVERGRFAREPCGERKEESEAPRARKHTAPTSPTPLPLFPSSLSLSAPISLFISFTAAPLSSFPCHLTQEALFPHHSTQHTQHTHEKQPVRNTHKNRDTPAHTHTHTHAFSFRYGRTGPGPVPFSLGLQRHDALAVHRKPVARRRQDFGQLGRGGRARDGRPEVGQPRRAVFR
jgi:hypothetical protein